jgi:pimeloyl-ACP methyl ester carboxylesterase
MTQKKFDFIDWFNEKFNQEKDTISFLSGKINLITDEVKKQFDELKDNSHYVVPIINGLHGDSMDEKGHNALIKMSFRYKSLDIKLKELKECINLADNEGKLIIMVHGLMNDETIWHSNSEDLIQRMGTFLENQNKANILYIRYNTGRHISQNGRDFSSLIQNLIDNSQNNIKELTIISHSMGGLVTRSAGYYAEKLGHNWLSKLKKVFLIGVPNEGSYLARVAHMTQYFLRKFDPTENDAIAKFLEIRSNGIKDLSFGFLVDEDWQNPNYEKEKKVKATKVYPVPNVEYYLVAGTVSTNSEKKKIFTFFGDGLVEKQSALSDLFKENESQQGMVHFKLFENENHLSLLESEKVQEFMLECLKWK